MPGRRMRSVVLCGCGQYSLSGRGIKRHILPHQSQPLGHQIVNRFRIIDAPEYLHGVVYEVIVSPSFPAPPLGVVMGVTVEDISREPLVHPGAVRRPVGLCRADLHAATSRFDGGTISFVTPPTVTCSLPSAKT